MTIKMPFCNRLILLVTFSYSCSLTAETTSILPAPEKVTEHVYAWVGPLDIPRQENKGYRMNMAFVVGSKSVAVIDTGYTEDMAEEMLTHIRKLTSLPVKYAINSNSQPHRFMGNDVFRKQGASIIAHKRAVARMKKNADEYTARIESVLQLPKNWVQSPELPNMVFDKPVTVDLGNVTLKISSMGPTHTADEVIVDIVEDKIIYAGDILYSGRLPAVLPSSNIKNWLSAYKKLDTYKNYTFIPGHGQPAKLSAFQFPTYSYIKLLHDHIAQALDDLTDMGETLKSIDQNEYKTLANFSELAGRNASWAYVTMEAQSM